MTRFDSSKLTWTCHVCGDRRPDAQISVHVKTTMFHNAPIVENIRYCNDRQECIDGAPDTSHFSKEAV